MKTKQILLMGMIGLAFAGMIITGCKKEATADTDATASQDDANASFMINESKTISDGAAKGQATDRVLGTAGQITKSDTLVGGVLDTLLDVYFPGGLVSPDGRTRKGHIRIWWHGTGYFDSAASISETWYNYSIYCPNNLTTISMANGSTRTLTNNGQDASGDCNWSFSATLTFTYSGATTGTATWASSRTNTLEQVNGVWYYYINGSASGTSRTGVAYTLTITQPLVWSAYWLNILAGKTSKICDCFEAGQVEYQRTGKTYPLYLTFTSGVGNCSHTATATINGNAYNITLP